MWKVLPEPQFDNLQRPVFFRVMKIPAGNLVEAHDHPYGQLSFATRGVMLARAHDTSYVIPPQHALWCPPFVEHELRSRTGVAFCGVYIGHPWLHDLPAESCVLEVTPLMRELIREASTLPAAYDEQGAEGRMIACLMDQLVRAREVAYELPLPEDPRLAQLATRLLERPDDKRTLEQWADQIGATSRTLNRLCHKEMGMGFREWRQRLRMLEAVQRLESGEAVTSVALALGYNSASAFINRFKTLLGVTPGEYLRRA
ncbi:AraC family transcriptional regulator [Marinobacterium arenosum]|uniref:AraC family transcriptional regulator n=1 Tax=Marinobacterium arenosum TaxID=2862496 RepID=UPI001C968455|nr:helix-turn-helix transcriptional regulator [Marinobacterium arenosum]MBY4676284.1 helix-turn-helix transcriptional regulator [Marinobacterium arenosum]